MHTSSRRSYMLAFPSNLSADQVVSWVLALSGTFRPGSPGATALVVELWSNASGFTYRLRAPKSQADYIVGQLRSLIPGIRVTLEARHPRSEWIRVVELGTRRLGRTLRVPDPEVMAATLLASLQPQPGETVLLQWVAIPAKPERLPEQRQAVSQRGRQVVVTGDLASPSKDTTADRRAKLALPNILAVLRIAVQASDWEQTDRLLTPIRSALMSVRTPDNGFYKRLVPQGVLQRRVEAGHVPRMFPAQLSAAEFAGLIAWPMGAPHIAGLPRARTRHLAATESIPRAGRILGRSNWPGNERPLALSPRASASHLEVVGPNGTGKTNALAGLVRNDMQSGAGVIVIESKGDLFRSALDAVPDNRIDDVIVLSVTDTRRPVGFNVLAEGNSRVAVEELCRLFEYLYPDMRRGVWARAALHRGLSTLATSPGLTFVDLVPLLSAAARTDAETAWRNELIANLKDPELKRFWERFAVLPASQQENWAAPILDRVWQLNERPEIRNIIGQSRSAFSMREVVRDRKILLVNLFGLGKDTASLTSSLLINALWAAVRSGAGSPQQPTYLFLDEFGDYTNLPVNPEDMLSKARSMGLAISIAHQHLGQLPPDIRSAVMANCRSKLVFQCAADDARVFAREFGRQVTDEDIQQLGQFEFLARIMTADGVSDPVTGVTYPPASPAGNTAAVRHRSRMRYGRRLKDVEAEIQQRRTPKHHPSKRPKIGRQEWES